MTHKDRIRALLNNQPADRVGFWLGHPLEESQSVYCEYFGAPDRAALAHKLGDDFWHIGADGAWQHPKGEHYFDYTAGRPKASLGDPGRFADCGEVAEVEVADWPDPEFLGFSEVTEYVERISAEGFGIFGGLWSMFFHDLADFFGMEDYFIKMHTHPEVVEAVTDKVVGFYLEANKRCFDAMAQHLDAYFMGNDFGSQLDLLVSPEQFRRFILPGLSKLIDLAKSYNLPVVLHSCGAIWRVIPLLIDAGLDALHPVQARAVGMDAESLAREYGEDLLFVGGVDTQQILPYGTPEEVRAEVRRLKRVFGERYVVSPSHEALLPNVPPENVEAMWQAAME